MRVCARTAHTRAWHCLACCCYGNSAQRRGARRSVPLPSLPPSLTCRSISLLLPPPQGAAFQPHDEPRVSGVASQELPRPLRLQEAADTGITITCTASDNLSVGGSIAWESSRRPRASHSGRGSGGDRAQPASDRQDSDRGGWPHPTYLTGK